MPDREREYQAYMVYMLAIIWSIVTAIIVSVGFFFFPEIWLRWFVFLTVSLVIAFSTILINHFGFTRFASLYLTVMLWLYITLPCYSAGGIMAPGIFSQLSVILTAGFLLGWRGGFAIGLLTICADFGLVYLEQNNLLPAPSVTHTPITRWIGAIIPLGTILALQYYATNHLRAGLRAMEREILNRKDAEFVKDQSLKNLHERIKELKALYAVSKILQNEDIPYQVIVREIAEELVEAWQYPEITAVRICLAKNEYFTANYRPTDSTQLAEIHTAQGTKILIEVVYLEERPEADEGPFLMEERNLIDMLVEMIKTYLERRERKVELKDYKYALDVSSIVSISDVNGTFLFANDNFCRISKYELSELKGRHHSLIWSGYHDPEYFEELRVSMQNGVPFRGEFCNKAKDGTLYWLDSSIVPFLDENGTVYQYLSINHDITDRKRAEYIIKEQSEIFQAIIENTKESILLISPEFRIVQFNSTARQRIQETRGLELQIGADFREYLFPENTAIFYSMFNDSLNGIYRVEETVSKAIDGRSVWFQSKTAPVYNLDNELIGVRLLTESIDDRKMAEVVLRESEEKFRSIVEQSLIGIYIIQDGKLIYVNPGFEKIFGYSKETLLERMSFESLVHADDISLVQSIHHNRVDKGKTKEHVFRAHRKDGSMLHVEMFASTIHYNNGLAVIGTLVDITERIEEEGRINMAVLNAQEKERLQIGMELHDNVQQILAGTGLFLEFAQENLDDKDALNDILETLKKYNAEGTNELRRLSHQLAPLVETESSLEEKVMWLVKSLKLDTSLSTQVFIDERTQGVDNLIQLNIYRILQEQLTNIRKYAKASHVEINIRAATNTIQLQVKDNGQGFNTEARREGIGLENIRRRVKLLNGTIEIKSSIGNGCELNILIPI